MSGWLLGLRFDRCRAAKIFSVRVLKEQGNYPLKSCSKRSFKPFD